MNQPANTRFAYGYHGSREYGTYFDCIVTDVLIDGQLVVADQSGERLLIDPWAFTKKGEVQIDLSQVEQRCIVSLCVTHLTQTLARLEEEQKSW